MDYMTTLVLSGKVSLIVVNAQNCDQLFFSLYGTFIVLLRLCVLNCFKNKL